MRQAGRVCAGIGLVLTLCGFAPPAVGPALSPPRVPIHLLPSILSVSKDAPALEFPVADDQLPLAAALTPDTRRQVETLLIHA